MVDDGKVPMFKEQGCWLTCHEGERDLNPATNAEVAANAAMKAYKKSDVRKYLPASRSNVSDWKTGKSPEELAKIKAAGGFVDLIQWRGHRTNPVGGADDGYVLEWRNFDDGKNHFASNLDAATKQPKFMFDAGKFGSKAVTADQVGKKDNFLIKGENAVPFDPNAGWKAGDMLPRYALTADGCQRLRRRQQGLRHLEGRHVDGRGRASAEPGQSGRQGAQGRRRVQRRFCHP